MIALWGQLNLHHQIFGIVAILAMARPHRNSSLQWAALSMTRIIWMPMVTDWLANGAHRSDVYLLTEHQW
jgi:hypothetical protein